MTEIVMDPADRELLMKVIGPQLSAEKLGTVMLAVEQIYSTDRDSNGAYHLGHDKVVQMLRALSSWRWASPPTGWIVVPRTARYSTLEMQCIYLVA